MFSFGNDKVHNSMREIVGIQSQSPITVDVIKGWFLIESTCKFCEQKLWSVFDEVKNKLTASISMPNLIILRIEKTQ